MLIWNSQGIRNKISELEQLINREKTDVIIINEPKIKQYKPPKLKNYKSLYQKNDININSGGLLMYYKSNLITTKIDTNTSTFESMAVKIGNKIIVAIYILPNANLDISELKEIMDLGKNVVIAGDFNCHHTNWNCNITNRNGLLLQQTADRKNFIIKAPLTHTHIPHSGNTPSIIDLFVTKNINSNSPLTLQELSSDHLPVTMEIYNNLKIRLDPRPIVDYKNAKWKEFREFITNSIKINNNTNSIENIHKEITNITQIIQQAKEKFIPLILPKTKQIEIPQEIINDIKYRNRLRRQLQRNRTMQLKNEIAELNTLIRLKLESNKQTHWANFIRKINIKDNSLWKMNKYFKNSSNDTSIPTLHGPNGLVEDEKEKTNTFARTYQRIHEQTDHMSDNDTERMVNRTIADFNKININMPYDKLTSPQEIFKIIKNTRPKKAPGYDGIQNILLKNLPKKAIIQLNHIFNGCLKTGYFPSQWKNAHILPFKKPGKNDKFPQNYRPISLLPTLSKILEKIILSRLQEEEENKEILIQEQFGFRKYKSTVLQLAKLVDKITKNFNINKTTSVLTLDIEKAFDTVWINGLIYKLINYKFSNYIIKIIISYLKNRTIQVKINNSLSDIFAISAGVPQGGLLSPVLFIIYINDIPKLQNTNLALFADDTAVISESNNININILRLQNHVNELETFFDKWKIKVNTEKTKLIHFTKKLKKSADNNLYFYGETINEEPVIKYLGVNLDQKLVFSAHIKEVIKKSRNALSSLYPLLNSSSVLELKLKIHLYNTVIKPILLYACPVFSLASKTHINKIQIFQNKCIRIILNKSRYTRIQDLHDETNIMLIKEKMLEISKKFFNIIVKKLPETENIGQLNKDTSPFRIKHKLINNILL